MPTPREQAQDPFKTWKFLVFPSIKARNILYPLLKSVFAICSFASIFILLYIALSNPSSISPEYDYRRLIKWDRRPEPINISSSSAIIGEETNASHILFGIAGSVKSWDKRRRYSELWWNRNTMRGFVWLEEKPIGKKDWGIRSPPYRVSGNTSSFKYSCWYGSRSAIRIARILKESYELGLKNVRWFVMGDDDTVFFSENLVMVLGKYDHNQMYYIGGNSESVEQDVRHSYTMAYGGGGFAISYPLATELVRILDGCINRYAHFYGSDQKIQGCISELGVPLTKELGFHQLDIRGNPYGLLAAHPVAPLVSLHHLDYVESLFPDMNQLESVKRMMPAYDMDTGRILQQCFCHDLRRNWSFSVSWGFTVQLYPSLVTAKELETAFLSFRTWRTWGKEPFTFNTRHMSPDACQRPLLYFMDRVERVGSGQTRSRYKRFVDESEKECDRDDYAPALAVSIINVSASKLMPDAWKKAPRRQCCAVSDDNVAKGVMEVKIKGCRRFESVTPP